MRRLASSTLMLGAAALFAGCSVPPTTLPNHATPSVRRALHHRTFHFTGEAASFVVPSGVTQLTVTASGASGAILVRSTCARFGGHGALVHATIPVTASERLVLYVGGQGGVGWSCGTKAGNGDGGFNGGAHGGHAFFTSGQYYDEYYGDGGGGASDIRQNGSTLDDRILVAAGGGGSGGGASAAEDGGGGAGGKKRGGDGSGQGGPSTCQGWGGLGGTERAGGKGGRGGPDRGRGIHGVLGFGGIGANAKPITNGGAGGGGGGGGYYGGGGGGSGTPCTGSIGAGGGGGGGSSYVEPTATSVTVKKGDALPGDGTIALSW